MGAKTVWRLAWMAVAVSSLVGCDPRGGPDPRDAPGCPLNAYRCDGTTLQLCQIDVIERRKTWWDVDDCVALGRDVGAVYACVEQGTPGQADCEEVKSDAGLQSDGGDAGATVECPEDGYRCDGHAVQVCVRASGGGWAWRELWDCKATGEDIGRVLVCIEQDAGLGADCAPAEPDGGVAGVDD